MFPVSFNENNIKEKLEKYFLEHNMRGKKKRFTDVS